MSKKLKFLAMVLTCIVLSINQILAATTSTLTLSSSNKFGTSSGSTKKSSDNVITWTATTTTGAIQNTYSASTAYDGQQFGTGTTAWTGTFTTSSISSKKVTSVAIVANTGGSATLNVSVGGTTYTTANQSVTKKANGAGPLTYTFSGTKTGAITITVSGTSKAFYLKSIAVTYEDAAVVTTVSASPSSITFDDNTVDVGTDEATSTITLANGYASAGNYLYGWFEDVSDADHCDFYVNEDYTYSYTTSGSATPTLTFSYLADAAGTYTANFIIQGYNSSYTAVNCTIPLSVTLTSGCDKAVTISKGGSTNCSFTLSKSGAQASCDGVSTTVTITPNSGYGKNPSVTQSGASAAPTITGSGNNWTVAYGANTTGTSTINVSCAANDYTITLDKDLTPTTAGTASITATYNANTNLTSAITKPTKTGWTFAGYFTAKNGGGTQIIGADGNVIASVSGYTDASKNWKYVGNITLYAKWTCTVTWSVNEATNVYDAQTVTYNSSGCRVASVPGPPSPASYCGQVFAGWTNASIDGSQDSAPGTLFKAAGESPDLKTIGNTTFYAVFADYDD